MSKDEILEKVTAIICKSASVPKEKVKPETRIQEDLGLDSLTIADMMMEVEDQLNVSISDEIEGKVKTVNELVSYINDELAKKKA